MGDIVQKLKPEEQINRARQLCHRLSAASTTVGPPWNRRNVRGVDPNELKKLYTFLIKHRNMEQFRNLVQRLPETNFAKRSGSTPGYHKNIRSGLGSDFYELPIGDAIQVLGWTCRLLTTQEQRRR